MKKRYLILILSLTAMLTCILGLTACGGNNENGNSDNPPHIHEFTTLKYDTTNHWYECSCGAKQNEVNHVFNNGDDCACGYKSPHTHNYYELKSNSISHWFECECGDKKDIETHKGGLATETSKAVCSVCNQEYGSVLGHSHTFTEQVVQDIYLKEKAKCESKAKYYYSCECGEMGTETFESGVAQGHSFTNYKSDNNATYEADGTKTATCDRDNCNKTDTIIDEGSKLITSEGLEYELNSDGQSYSVTGIGTCKDANIIIPSTYENKPVTSIGDEAFYDCDSLTSVVIGDSVTSIGAYAFAYCYSLTSVVIGDSVTSIGGSAFYGCYKLVEVINKSSHITVTKSTNNGYLGYYALAIYNSDSGITESQLNIDNGYIVYTEGSENILVGYNGSQTNLTIPNYITKIYNFAFYNCDLLTSIEISNSVTSIGNSAFYDCNSLTSVTIGDSVTSIGSNAFYNCNSLTSIEIPNSVTSMGSSTFAQCYSLTSATIGNSVASIGKEAFRSCSSLTSIEIPNSITSIGSRAFDGCNQLKNVNYLGAIGDWAQTQFTSYYSNPLTYAKNLYINNQLVTQVNITTPTKINDYAFYNCDSLISIAIGNSVTSIGKYAFHSCSNLTNIKIQNSVTNIGDNTFSYCNNLINIEIPSSVTSIGNSAFANCYNLSSVEIPSSVTTIGDSLFENCNNLTSVTIGNSVTSIGNSAFYNCNNLTSIEIPNSVTSIGGDAFEDCNNLTSVTIGNSVTSIGGDAFRNCDNLTSVTIGNSVTSIGYRAFANCYNLTKVNYTGTIDDWVQIRFAYGYSDNYCYSNPLYYTKNLYINEILVTEAKEAATKINDYAFYNCKNLTSVTIGNSVASIGVEAFYNCENLTSATIGNSVASIGKQAFRDCYSLTSIEIPSSVKRIGYGAFLNCNALTIYCRDYSRKTDWDSYWNNSLPVVWDCNHNDVATNGYIYTIIDGVRYALKDGEALIAKQANNIMLANILTIVNYKDDTYSVTSIGKHAFYECTNLTSIVIPNSVTSIGDYAFLYCESLTSIKYRGSQAQWSAITKDAYWNYNTGNYTITYNYTGE